MLIEIRYGLGTPQRHVVLEAVQIANQQFGFVVSVDGLANIGARSDFAHLVGLSKVPPKQRLLR